MASGRPNRDEPTWVLAVRVPVARREALDRSLDALEARLGLKASRNESIRHALRQFLAAQLPVGQPRPPQPLHESWGDWGAAQDGRWRLRRHDRGRDWRPPLPLVVAHAGWARRGLDCRTGLRKADRTSGGSCTHHGPRGATWTPSRGPAVHPSAIVDTDTLSGAAAAWARERPSPRGPVGPAAGPTGQPLLIP